MSVLPDPGATRAVLVGTSRYQHLEQLPAVSNNLQALVRPREISQVGGFHRVQLGHDVINGFVFSHF